MSRSGAVQSLPWRASFVQTLFPGAAVAVVISLAASAIAFRYGAPVMLFALLLGMAMSFLAEDPRLTAGIRFAASNGLKFGVALMGLRVSLDLVMDLGAGVFALIAFGSATTIGVGLLIGRFLGWNREQTIIASGAVAICGASAALALSSVTRSFRDKDDHTLVVILAATTLSTAAMIFYPVLLEFLGFSDVAEGIILGASIHDVAQVVGAGFSVSDSAGESATLSKMTRVALLPVVLLAVQLLSQGRTNEADRRKFGLPWFVTAFLALMVLNQIAPIPAVLVDTSRWLSSTLLIIAVAALGLSSAPKRLLKVGGTTLAFMGVLSLWLLLCASVGIWLIG